MKPRALMIIHNFRPGTTGGAELQAERLATSLAAIGHDMQVLTRRTVPHALREETSAGVRIHRVEHELPYRVTHDNSETFRFLVKERGSYDVLHAHMAFGHAVVAVVAARSLGKRCVIKVACAGEYGDLSTFSKFPGFAQALPVLRQADRIVAISRQVESELLDWGWPLERIVRIPNGVDTTHFRREAPIVRESRVRFVLTGRRHPQKGIDAALLAARKLVDDGLGERFAIDFHGDDYPEHDYPAMARQLKLDGVVKFHPFKANALGIYQSAHAMLLPSRGEGMSNALLEAMAMELPVVVTRVSGTLDVVDAGIDALVVPPDSPEALAASMAGIILDPQLSRELGARARTKVVERFSLESVAQRYSDLYRAL